MTYSILCDEPAPPPCPPKFRLRASGWIDDSNLGENSIGTRPPAGIRLRWNCPFLEVDPTARRGKPVSYEVQRSEAFDPEALWLPQPNAGHSPRTPTPKNRWRPLDRVSPILFSVGDAGPCDGVDAVYFEMPAGHARVTVTLVATDGTSKVSGEVTGGDVFYFELADTKFVIFSGPCQAPEILGLFLGAGGGDGVGSGYQTLAVIEAEAWLDADLAQIAERLATRDGTPFVGIAPADWSDLQLAGRDIRTAFDAGVPLPTTAVNTVQLAAALRWELATLIGWGFIDGEHPDAATHDALQLAAMLPGTDDRVYAYRIEAVLTHEDGETRRQSVPAFGWARQHPQLESIGCRAAAVPVARSRLTNAIDPGRTRTKPTITATPRARVFCATSWEIATITPATEIAITRPVGDDSALTGQPFEEPGEFNAGSNPNRVTFRGLSQIQRRDLSFEIPYFDSDVGLELAAADGWDRRQQQAPTKRVQPDIDYAGNCIPVGNARCNGNLGADGRGTVAIALTQDIPWEADALAAGGGGRILLLMRDPGMAAAESDVEIGPASPLPEGDWSAEIRATLPQADYDRFVDGTLAIGGLTARIKAMAPRTGGRVLCTFEVKTKCASVNLYMTPNGVAAATLTEDPNASRLWIDLEHPIAVLGTGQPAQYSAEPKLPQLDHSQMLSFATRLVVEFEGKTYTGPVTTPFPAPYVHPAPKAPETCFNVDQLATDFYGRSVVRIDAAQCPALDPAFAVRATMAPGSDLSADDYLSARSEGLYGAQNVFERDHLFEIFEALGRQPEGSGYMIGLAYVREADGRESQATLQSFTARRVD